jgi:hypothetical protein
LGNYFQELGIQPADFIQISASFVLTMLVFFGLKERKHLWLKCFLLATFALQCIFMILFHAGLNVKLFAGLMLFSAVTVVAVSSRKNKVEVR